MCTPGRSNEVTKSPPASWFWHFAPAVFMPPRHVPGLSRRLSSRELGQAVPRHRLLSGLLWLRRHDQHRERRPVPGLSDLHAPHALDRPHRGRSQVEGARRIARRVAAKTSRGSVGCAGDLPSSPSTMGCVLPPSVRLRPRLLHFGILRLPPRRPSTDRAGRERDVPGHAHAHPATAGRDVRRRLRRSFSGAQHGGRT
jgi:hypothetical protein